MDYVKAQYNLLGPKVVEKLKNNHFKAYYTADKETMLDIVLGLAKAGEQVAFGGSMTVKQLELGKALKEHGCTIMGVMSGISEEAMEKRRKHLAADLYISSSNAVTMNGELVNTDSIGNRVASMMFGPKRIVIVVGANKLVKDINMGMERVHSVAAPQNCIMFDRATPCAKTGVCMNCNSPERICNITTIMHKAPRGADIHVIIVGENLGM